MRFIHNNVPVHFRLMRIRTRTFVFHMIENDPLIFECLNAFANKLLAQWRLLPFIALCLLLSSVLQYIIL